MAGRPGDVGGHHGTRCGSSRLSSRLRSWTQGCPWRMIFGMRTFKPYDLDQPYLLPPDLRSWLSEGHLSLFLSDVVDALNLSAILDAYERGDGRGYPNAHDFSWGTPQTPRSD